MKCGLRACPASYILVAMRMIVLAVSTFHTPWFAVHNSWAQFTCASHSLVTSKLSMLEVLDGDYALCAPRP